MRTNHALGTNIQALGWLVFVTVRVPGSGSCFATVRLVRAKFCPIPLFIYHHQEWLRAQGIISEPVPRPPPQRRRRTGLTINTRNQNINTRNQNMDKAAAHITKPETPIYTTVSPDMLTLRSPPLHLCKSPILAPKDEAVTPRISPSRARQIIPFDVMQGDGTGFPGYDPRYWQTNSSDESTSDDFERIF
jgi:hypothetical protein